jgi:hypothetical protein
MFEQTERPELNENKNFPYLSLVRFFVYVILILY